MESTFADRVKEFRKHKKLSQTAFAEQCGLEQGNITQMENGTEPKQSNISKLVAGFPDLNSHWLLTGEGNMLANGRTLTPVAQLPPPVPSKLEPTQPGSGEGGLFISPKSAAEEIGYWRNKYEQEHAAHERTRNQGHERETLLIKRIGGKTEASADAADPTHTASMAVSFVNPDQVATQAFLRRRAAAYAPAADNLRPVRVRGFVASLR